MFCLTYSVWASQKFWFFAQRALHVDKCEFGAMAVSHPDDPFYIRDIYVPKQEVSLAGVEFDEDDIALYQDRMSSKHDLDPVHCMRIWMHTHPEKSVAPRRS